MLKKFFSFFRFAFLMTAFIFLLLPFMFFSVLNKGVKKAKNILGFQNKDSSDDHLFTDNQAWADFPPPPPPPVGRCIYFHYSDAKGDLIQFSELIPRTEESLHLINIPKEAISTEGDLNLELKWTRTHRLASLGLIEHEISFDKKHQVFESELIKAIHGRTKEDQTSRLKENNLNYMHTVQGDNVDLIFQSKIADKELKLQIEERDPEESFMDQIKVFEVEHEKDQEVIIGSDLKNFYVLPKEKIKTALMPHTVSIMGKKAEANSILGEVFSMKSRGINLHYGQHASIVFDNLNPSRSYSLVAITKNRGWSPQAQTVFYALPKPFGLTLKFAFFSAIALASLKFWNNIGLSLPIFALLSNQSTPYLAVWNGQEYVLENDIMFSPTFNYDPNLTIAKNRYESGLCGPDLYCIKNYKGESKNGKAITYLVSASGFYTDLRIQNRKFFRNLAWLVKKAVKS